jgi:hypothetical protein
VIILIGAISVVFAAQYYQLVRQDIALLVRPDSDRSTTDVLQSVVTPSEVDASTLERVAERGLALDVLLVITREQMEEFRGFGGRLIFTSLTNLVPGFLNPSKISTNADELLPLRYSFAWVDLASGVLAILQAEIFLFAYLVAPMLYVSCWLAYSWMDRAFVNSWPSFVRLTVLGASLLAASYVESTLDALLVDFRNCCVLMLLALVGSLRSIWSRRFPTRSGIMRYRQPAVPK